MGYSFDGANKVIELTLGTTEVSIVDLYSRWVDWLAVGDNSKYDPAFRFVGGDPISDTKNLGITFFIINGWKIKPQPADHRLLVTGNLYTDPAGSSPFISAGTYNVTIEMTVSSLVDSTLAQMAEIEQASYNAQVSIDQTNSTLKAVSGTVYPIGTLQMPVNNLANAKTIANDRGFDTFYLKGYFTLDASDDVSALRFKGDGATLNITRTQVTFTQNCITTNSHWYNARITGYQGGEANYHECIIDGLDNAHCYYERCGLIDGTTRGYTIRQTSAVSQGHASYFKECYSDEGVAIIDRNGARLNATFDGWTGRMKVVNQNNANTTNKTITDATWANGKITFTSTAHAIIEGTRIAVSGITPSGYNGTFIVKNVTANTFQVDHGTDPTAYVSGGTGQISQSGNMWIHMNGGTLIVDSTCTKGFIKVSGSGTLLNNSGGTIVDATGFMSEEFERAKIDLEATRQSHQGYGSRWYVDYINGNDSYAGSSVSTPVKTITKAVELAVSGRGDVIYLLSPGSGTTTIDERVTINKEDVHIRAPGRGLEIKPSVGGLGPVINITGNNCSLNGLLLRTASGDHSDDCIVVNAKFCRLENLYVVGPDTGGGTVIGSGHGIHFKGGDYHKVFGCEIEKFGQDGVRFTDAPIGSEGSPREVRFDNCNIYYNRGNGIGFTGTSSNSTRLNVVTDSRIQHNSGYGIYIGANTQRTMIMANNFIKDNKTYPTGIDDPANEIYVDPAASDAMIDVMPDTLVSNVWGAVAADHNDAGTMGNKLNTASSGGVDLQALADAVWDNLASNGSVPGSYAVILKEIYQLYGLDPTKPLVVTQNSRTAGVGISQNIVTNSTQTTVTRI